MNTYECDVCGRACSRTHQCWAAGGTETYACDDCCGYEWEAYDEEPDPLLYPVDPDRLREDRDENRRMLGTED